MNCSHLSNNDSCNCHGLLIECTCSRLLTFLIVTFCCANAFAQEQTTPASSTLYQAAVEIQDEPDAPLTALAVTAEVYQHAQTDLHDLRLIDSFGKEVPFLLRQRSTTRLQRESQSRSVTSPELKPLDNGDLQIDFSLQENAPAVSFITLHTPLDNYEQHVDVYQLATVDGGTEPTLLTSATIFDYSRFMNVRRNGIRLPDDNNARRIRLVLKQLTQSQRSSLRTLTRKLQGEQETGREEEFSVIDRNFRIDRIDLTSEKVGVQVTGPVLQEWPITFADPVQDDAEKQTLIEVTASGQPITEFRLISDQTDFQRSARVQIWNSENEEWTTLATSSLQKFAFDGVNEERMTLQFPARRETRFRIAIANLDSPPLQITGVTAFGSQSELVFMRSAADQLQLQCGNVTLNPPQYDLAAIKRLIERRAAVAQASITALLPAGTIAETAGDPGAMITSPFVWGPLIAVLLALLARSLYSAGKKLDTAGFNDSQSE